MDPDAVGVTGLDARLEELVRSSDWLMAALRVVRDVDPPDWLVGGGVLRDLVWDRLHGRAEPGRPRDVDLAFFDPLRLDAGRDAEVEQALVDRLAGVPWDAKNQAAVHRWYGRVFGGEVAPLASAADGVGTWPETATAVAVRLLDGDELRVVAPAAWRTCSRWSAGATPGGSVWRTTGAGCATSGSRNAGRRSPSSTRGPGPRQAAAAAPPPVDPEAT